MQDMIFYLGPMINQLKITDLLNINDLLNLIGTHQGQHFFFGSNLHMQHAHSTFLFPLVFYSPLHAASKGQIA